LTSLKGRPEYNSVHIVDYPKQCLERWRPKSLAIIVGASLFVCASIEPAQADCSGAISAYNSALSDIETYLKRYTRCLSSSNGSDDCSSEFRRLRSAQSDFESAVSDHQAYCRR